jgi:hypothetical protein
LDIGTLQSDLNNFFSIYLLRSEITAYNTRNTIQTSLKSNTKKCQAKSGNHYTNSDNNYRILQVTDLDVTDGTQLIFGKNTDIKIIKECAVWNKLKKF